MVRARPRQGGCCLACVRGHGRDTRLVRAESRGEAKGIVDSMADQVGDDLHRRNLGRWEVLSRQRVTGVEIAGNNRVLVPIFVQTANGKTWTRGSTPGNSEEWAAGTP